MSDTRDADTTNANHSSGSGKPRTYRCPGCNAGLLFEPVEGCLTCPYCGRSEKIPDRPDEIRENSFEEYLAIPPSRLTSFSSGFVEHQCPACNAVLELPAEQAAGSCPFCGTAMVLLEASPDPLLAPEGLLPMAITSVQGQAAVKKWLETRWFAPNRLKKFARQETLRGVYLPFWTFDADTFSSYSGKRGEYYYETEVSTEYVNGEERRVERQVRRVRWYPASGTVKRRFDDVIVPATRSLREDHLHSIGPWDLGNVKPFDAAFLSGFSAERYRIDLRAGFDRAKQTMAPVIVRDAAGDIGGDEQQVDHVKTAYFAITFKHLLFPVWAGAYRLNDKVYQIAVNGRTGAVHGDRPYSIWKIILAVLFALCAAAIGLEVMKAAPEGIMENAPAPPYTAP